MLDQLAPVMVQTRIIVPDRKVCVVSMLRAPYVNPLALKQLLENLLLDGIQSVIWLGDMLESVEGLETLKKVFLWAARSVQCQYWIKGRVEESLGPLGDLVSAMGVEDLVEDGKLILCDSIVEVDKWVIAYEKLDNLYPLSVAKSLAKQYQKNILVARAKWAVSEVDGWVIIDSGAVCARPGLSTTLNYWYVVDSVPIPQRRRQQLSYVG